MTPEERRAWQLERTAAAARELLRALDGEQPHLVEVRAEQLRRRLEELDRREAGAVAA